MGKCTAARVPLSFAPHSPPVAEDSSLSGQLSEEQLNEEMRQPCTDGAERAPAGPGPGLSSAPAVSVLAGRPAHRRPGQCSL